MSLPTTEGALARLERIISDYPAPITAFSGGVDSTLVAVVAARVHGDDALAVTGVSASLSNHERRAATDLATSLGLRHRCVDTHEMRRAGYRKNTGDRCYHCKSELFELLRAVARSEGRSVVLCGDNLDDLGDDRPGMRAAHELGVRSPLIEAEIGKPQIRAIAQSLGLANHAKFASPCLASRVPVGRPVDAQTLARIEGAEDALRELGLGEFRVRDHGELARIELRAADMQAAYDHRARIVAALKRVGYRWVTCDLAGFRGESLPILDARSPS